MKRLEFFKKQVVCLLGITVFGVLATAGIVYGNGLTSVLAGFAGILGCVALTFLLVKSAALRLLDIAPKTDRVMLFGVFIVVNLLTGGLLGLGLFIVPSNFLKGA